MSDDLSKINGIGPATVEKLNSRGITSFAQLAELTDDQILQLNDELDLRDSIVNHDWRSQAAKFGQPANDQTSTGDQGSGAGNTPTPPEPEKPVRQTVAVSIKRDIWDGEGNRHRKGTVVDMPIEEAMDAIEAGSVSRVKG